MLVFSINEITRMTIFKISKIQWLMGCLSKTSTKSTEVKIIDTAYQNLFHQVYQLLHL